MCSSTYMHTENTMKNLSGLYYNKKLELFYALQHEIFVPLLNALNTLFHSSNYYFYSAQNMTVFRDNMFIQKMNVSFMALDSLKENLTAEYRVEYFPSPQSHHE